ncbi:MAG TPA: Cthe_2314 family HEPN domain-containing protein [Flavipsychrobacter sp.]|jgi:hypothetical protein|nr:Cthe_2314 family HEPN domain-containing protein [Flavipsychrobacter sp.]
MEKEDILQSVIRECQKHSKRLDFAFRQINPLLPFTSESVADLKEETVSYLDQYIFRFSKLQDALGNKLFKAVLASVGEDFSNKTFIDIFHRLEQLDIINDYAVWNRLRVLRNEIAHDYDVSDYELAEKLNELLSAHDILRVYFKLIYDYCKKKGLCN